MTTTEFGLIRDSTPPRSESASSTNFSVSVPLTIETTDLDIMLAPFYIYSKVSVCQFLKVSITELYG